jgi:hypothetical protein
VRRPWLTVAVCVAGVASIVLGAAATAPGAPVLRGICDPDLVDTWRSNGPAVVHELATRLGADAVRINVSWHDAEPREGIYDEAYLERVASAVRETRAHGMQAIVLVWRPPHWASDRSLWGHPVSGDRAGVYQPYYPPALDALDEFAALMTHMAQTMRGEVLAYSCWVEPNLWTYLYPQRTASDPAFAAHRYTRMLAAFSQGVRAGDPAALVVGGETAPTGSDTRLSTGPQRFARQIRSAGAGAYFDVFAHHPYPAAGNRGISPKAMPRDPSHTVWLANLQTLLDLFPDKPFYLTEFAYPTSYSRLFGVRVSPARQAAYLTVAYRMAARYPQVQLLAWFPRKDSSEDGTYHDRFGNYSGLRTLRGVRKRAYYAYAGGNHLTMSTTSVKRKGGTTLALRGCLTSERMGPLAGKALVVAARRPGHSWVVVARARTLGDGSYVVKLRPGYGATWQVRWQGVATSDADWVPVVH